MMNMISGVVAYIDPNTGGMLFQILAASFALISGGVLIFSRQIRMGFAKLKRFAREKFGDGEVEASDESSAAEAQ